MCSPILYILPDSSPLPRGERLVGCACLTLRHGGDGPGRPGSPDRPVPPPLPSAAVPDAAASSPALFLTARSPLGKPFFPALPGLHFSISHSGAFWACLFSSSPVGLDLQEHTDCHRARLSRRFFHPTEDAWLAASGYETADFFDVWSAKESLVKYLGAGFTNGTETFSVIPSDEAGAASFAAGRVSVLPDPSPELPSDPHPSERMAQAPVTLQRLSFQPDYSLWVCGRGADRTEVVFPALHNPRSAL